MHRTLFTPLANRRESRRPGGLDKFGRWRRLGSSMLASLALAGAATAAVEVRFDHPENYADGGNDRHDAERVRAQLAAHLTALGAKLLPAGQTLTIDVLDIDLAGQMWPTRRLTHELRVLRGRADWPRIGLRYTLASDAGELTRGEEEVADMGYLSAAPAMVRADPLGYEKRMLDHWFRQRFAPARP